MTIMSEFTVRMDGVRDISGEAKLREKFPNPGLVRVYDVHLY